MNYSKNVNFVFLGTVLLSMLGQTVVGSINMPILARLIFSQVILIAPSAFFVIKFRLNLKETLRFHKIKGSNIILILLFSYLVSPFMSLINMISMLFVENVIQNTLSVVVEKNILLVSITFIALLPSLFEESIYRGIFYNEYRRVNVLKGMVLSAFLFGLMHMNFNQFFYAFAMGMIFVLLIEATDSIIAPMIVHFCINGSSVLMLNILPRILKLLEDISPEYSAQLQQSANMGVDKSEILRILPFNVVWATITLSLAVIVFRTIAKNAGQYEHVKNIFKRNKESTDGQLISLPLIIGIVICVGLMILNEVMI